MDWKRIFLSRIKQVMCLSVNNGLVILLSLTSSTPRHLDGGLSGYLIYTTRSHSMEFGQIWTRPQTIVLEIATLLKSLQTQSKIDSPMFQHWETLKINHFHSMQFMQTTKKWVPKIWQSLKLILSMVPCNPKLLMSGSKNKERELWTLREVLTLAWVNSLQNG